MTRSQRFKPVQNLHQIQEGQALEALADVQLRLQQAEQQFQQLQSYQTEYSQRFNQGQTLQVQQLQEFQKFYAQLAEAVKGQQVLIRQLHQEHDYKRGQWLQCHQRSSSLNKVVQRYQHIEIKQQDLREQKEMDEISQRRKSPAR